MDSTKKGEDIFGKCSFVFQVFEAEECIMLVKVLAKLEVDGCV